MSLVLALSGVSGWAAGTVAMPVFSPDGGTFNEEKDVVVTCVTPAARVHYTTDNSEPTQADPSVLSGETIAVTETSTLKARGFADGSDPSAIKSAGFTILPGALGVPPAEFSALVDLYNRTNGPGWTHHDNWLTDDPAWHGVTVAAGHVIGLELADNNLAGGIPASIGDLPKMQWLRLWINRLEGAIPNVIGSLTDLRDLGLGANLLDGPIPSSIGGLAMLESFTADNNKLSGGLPAAIGNLTKLVTLGLGSNKLTGGIPVELGDLQDLKNLWLDNNLFSGGIPSELGGLSSLEDLALINNQLVGEIPVGLGSLAELRLLRLGLNQLSGGIPAELGNLTHLTDLALDNNQLTGSIPPELGALANLRTLLLSSNRLTGSIPQELGDLANLRNLWMTNNLLSGGIPPELGNLTALESVSLMSNRLEGLIPSELGDLVLLQDLNLAGNRLRGEIPVTLVNLIKMNTLNLGSNSLKATDPDLSAYLDAHAPWGAESQTVEPTNLTAGIVDSTSVLLTWVPIVYFWDDGYYEIGISGTPGGPYVFDVANRTADKGASSLLIGGLAPGTPRYFVVRTVTLPLWINPSKLTSDPSNEATATSNALGVPKGEYDALAALYHSTDGDQWTDNTNWLTGTAPWFGVEVENGHVVSLRLGDNHLVGTLPAELGDLAGIKRILLDHNEISGTLPAELGNLTEMETLAVSVNHLTGGIPSSLGNLTSLYDLWLDGNQLSGSIPVELGNLAGLHTLQLSDNQLAGSIPPELAGLANLRNLWMTNNRLSGAIPAGLGNLNALESLSLMANQLAGAIPPELGGLANLTGLWLNSNQLSGNVPDLAGLTKMITFDLSGNALTGGVPQWLGDFAQLENLVLHRNQFTGPIPGELGRLSALKRLTLSYNQLAGPIPSELEALAELDYLALSGNNLTGSIPLWLPNLTKLTSLSLRLNMLSGPIPSELGSMTQLVSLALSNNQLSGEIPAVIADLTNLIPGTGLMLGYNCLTAHDPALISFLNAKNPGWSATQTIAPANIGLTGAEPGSVSLAWDPITYTADGGCYEVGIATTAGGGYSFDPAHRTPDKTAAGITISGLAPGTARYFVVRTFTPAHGALNDPLSNKSDLTSGLSGVIDPFEVWIAGLDWTGVSNPDLSRDGDPDGDSLRNELEFAFGLDPRLGTSVNPISTTLNGKQFSYTRRLGTGFSYKIYLSTNLLTWTLDDAASQDVTGTNGDVVTVAVTLSPAAAASGGKLFVRVGTE